VRDLLAAKAATSTSGEKCSLKVVANEAVGSIRQAVTNEAEVFKILQKAQERRCVKATSSNATSSRSHMLFTIQFTINSKDGTNQSGKLNVSTSRTLCIVIQMQCEYYFSNVRSHRKIACRSIHLSFDSIRFAILPGVNDSARVEQT
jgi:Kinesin motor domain